MSLQFEPGYYTKIRIDDEGKIQEVDNLTQEDLPSHTHSINDLNEKELKNKIGEVLSTFFANRGDCAVKFTYDDNTQTISADVNIDDDTIYKNVYGQLVSSESGSNSDGNNSSSSSSSGEDSKGSSSSTNSGNVSEIELLKLKESLPSIVLNTISTLFINNQNSAIVFDWDEVTNTISADLRYDGISITKDENGDLIATGSVPGEGGNCASHTHTSDQIEDFHEAVLNIFNEYKNQTVNNIDLSTLVDGVTIKINQYGQLVAVSSALQSHTHTLADITDYVEPIAAARQHMTALGEDVDYDGGVIDFSKLNIGYSILALSQYLQKVINKNISELDQAIKDLQSKEDSTGTSLLSINGLHSLLLDTKEDDLKNVYYSPSIELTLDFLPYEKGEIELLRNDITISKAKIENLKSKGDKEGLFEVKSLYTKRHFNARIIKLNIENYINQENKYTFQIKFNINNLVDFSNKIIFYSTPYKSLSLVKNDTTNTHKIGEYYFYNYPLQYKYNISIKDYNKYRFLPRGFNKGNISGISDKKNKTLIIKNLFEDTSINIYFEKECENSNSELYNSLLKITNGNIINDNIIPIDKNCIASFSIPNSWDCNSLRVEGIEEEYLKSSCWIEKSGNKALGSIEATETTKGYIPSLHTFSLVNVYDNGRGEMKFFIKGNKTINLKKVSIHPYNI